jgi:hypothetical protein
MAVLMIKNKVNISLVQHHDFIVIIKRIRFNG